MDNNNDVSPAPPLNAIDLLKQDHRKVEQLFEQYESAPDKRTKRQVAQTICTELEIHAKIEEQIFYPTSKAKAKEAKDPVNEGIVEHQGIKMLVKQISKMQASDEYFDSSVTVLKEYVKHHVKEEETEMFPKIESSRIDLDALGERLSDAKARLEKRGTGKPKAGSANRKKRAASSTSGRSRSGKGRAR